jgi:hypothetical protein
LSVSLTEQEFITRADSAAAKTWLKVDVLDEPGAPKDDKKQPAPPPEPAIVIATDWADIAKHAESRPLTGLTLDASTPTAAETLAGIAQPLGADQLALDVTVSGDLKSGGTASFEVRGVKLNSPVKPLENARTLFNAMQEGMIYGAQLRLTFKEPGRSGLKPQLEVAADKAGNDVMPNATFGKPAVKGGAKG